jgi:hypothetical protein
MVDPIPLKRYNTSAAPALAEKLEFSGSDPDFQASRPRNRTINQSESVASQAEKPRQFNRLRIALVSDFFVPNLGGVEMHMYNVGQCLMELGHKVIVVTTSYADERVGVRYLSNGMKVYHIPTINMYSQTSVPPFLHNHVNILRQIFIREQIQIMHGHQATAVLQIMA